jgi:HSP20 family molecular chaperone IbpA
MLRPGFFGETLMDEFLDDVAFSARNAARLRPADINVMKTDVQEGDNGYELDIELPGYTKEDVKAELKDGNLIITATHTAENNDDNDKYVRRERFWGTCSRSFYVGEKVTQEDIKAKFENGILKLFIPKPEEVPEVESNNYIAIEG